MTFDDLRVDPLLFPVAEVRLDGEDHLGPRDADAFLEVGRGRCVRDADDAAARENDSQIDRDRFRSHRQVQRDSVAPFRPRRFEAVCDPGRQATQVAVAHPADLLAPFGRVDDRQFLRIRTETALCDVEACTGEPIRMRDVGLRIEDTRRAFLEDDAEALDHRGPEVLTVSGGPSLQLVVGADVPPFPLKSETHLTNPGPGFSPSIAFLAEAIARSTASRGVLTGTNREGSTPALSIGQVRRAKTVLPRSKAWAISLSVP